MCTCESMRPGMAIAPSASITTSHAETWAAVAVPTWSILPALITIESPAATGSRQSPERIAPRFTIAVFIEVANSDQSVLSLQVLEPQSTDARVDAPAIGSAENHRDLVGQRGIGQHNGHPVVVGANIERILAGQGHIDRHAGCGALG